MRYEKYENREAFWQECRHVGRTNGEAIFDYSDGAIERRIISAMDYTEYYSFYHSSGQSYGGFTQTPATLALNETVDKVNEMYDFFTAQQKGAEG